MWLLLAISIGSTSVITEFNDLQACTSAARQLNLMSDSGKIVFVCSYKDVSK